MKRTKDKSPIWCLAIAGKTLVSGHSSGALNFWDCATNSHISTIQSRGDILTLTATENAVYATGTDPHVMHVSLSDSLLSANPTLTNSMRAHSHDIYSIINAGDFLVTGGETCDFGIIRLGESGDLVQKKVRHIAPWERESRVVVNEGSVLVGNGKEISVWDEVTQREVVRIEKHGDDNVIGICGKDDLVAYWDAEETRVLKVGRLEVDRMAFKENLPPAIKACIFADNDHRELVILTPDLQLVRVSISERTILEKLDLKTRIEEYVKSQKLTNKLRLFDTIVTATTLTADTVVLSLAMPLTLIITKETIRHVCSKPVLTSTITESALLLSHPGSKITHYSLPDLTPTQVEIPKMPVITSLHALSTNFLAISPHAMTVLDPSQAQDGEA